jgi:hypothetical protein
VDYKDGHWWDEGGWVRWHVVRRVRWHVAGVRDRLATRKANRSRDIVG